MAQHTDKVRQHIAQMLREDQVETLEALRDEDTEGLAESFSSLAQDSQEADLAREGLEHIAADTELSDDEAFALEAIILPRERPVVDIINDSYHQPPAPWKHLNDDQHKTLITAAIPNIGRVEIPRHPTAPYGGTGFVVGSNLIMTNRHVAETFATGVGLRELAFIPGRTPGIDFKQEVIPSEQIILNFERMLMVHPYWDCAIVQVSGLPAHITGLVLDGKEPETTIDRDIVVIGYPAQDPRNDLALQNRIFRGIFQRKRMQPGRLKGYGQVRSYGNTVEAITHDSSTLGGNSGSVVIDVTTGRVVGLHFAGVYLRANYAVPTWELALDDRVVDAGVNFQDAPEVGDPPPWDSYWGAEGAAPNPARRPPTRSPAAGEGVGGLLGPDWYERIDDAVLAEALSRDPDGTRSKLETVLGEADANEIIEDLTEETVEGLFTREPDPDLPEIIYLHGIMGGHLANEYGVGGRVWLNFLAFAKGNIAEKMTLRPDGLSDNHPSFALGPDGHLKLKYGKASRRWRKRRFVVHEFAYDWRKPIHTAADQLHGFIEQLAAANPNRRFALVAHSMGGLVSSIYAQRSPNWSDRIQRAVFVGSPLGGSYAPIEAVLGVYPFFKALAGLSRHDDILDLRALAVTLPGLLQMMPNPGLFDDPVDCYTLAPWPNGPKPLQRWLDLSRNVKSQILDSPLLDRTSGIVSREFGTVATATLAGANIDVGPRTGPGDGTVPIRAAAVAELAEMWEAKGDRHTDLLTNSDVITAVSDILREGTTNALNRIRLEDIDFDEVLPESELAEVDEAASAGIRARMDEGLLTSADVDYLLDPIGYEMPQ